MSSETNHTEFDRELLSAYVDGELTAEERAEVEARLASDPMATRQVEEFRRLSGMIKSLPRPTLPVDFSEKVLQRAKQDQPVVKAEPLRPGIRLGRSWRSWVWAGAALAAALLIMVALPQRQLNVARQDAAGERDKLGGDSGLRNSRGEEDRVMTADAAVASDETALPPNGLANQPPAVSSRMSVPDELSKDPISLGAAAPEPRLLIVRVSMPPEALAKRELDRVFARNDIDVELAGEAEKLGDERTVDRAQETGGERRHESYAFGLPKSIEEKDADAQEVVLVEAPEEQILACLETMQKDAANFYSVEVEEDSPLLKLELAEKKLAQDKWQRFNRGSYAKLEERTRSVLSEEVAPPENALPEAAPPEIASPPPQPAPSPPVPQERRDNAEGAIASRPDSEQPTRPDSAESEKSQNPMSLVPLGKAYRYWNMDEPRKRALSDLTRRQSQQEVAGGRGGFAGRGTTIDAGKQPLQVLFVVQDSPPSLAAPADGDKPLPAAEVPPK